MKLASLFEGMNLNLLSDFGSANNGDGGDEKGGRSNGTFLIFSFKSPFFVVHTPQTKDRKNVKAAINKKKEKMKLKFFHGKFPFSDKC
jgi:hypothetical protein